MSSRAWGLGTATRSSTTYWPVSAAASSASASQTSERAPRSGGAQEGRAKRGDDLPDPVFVLGEAGPYHAGVKAVGVQLRRAPGQLTREEDVAQLGGAVDARGVGALTESLADVRTASRPLREVERQRRRLLGQ